MQSLSGIAAGLGIGFYYSWELTLCVLGFGPFIMLANLAQIKITSGLSKRNDTATENAGKVSYSLLFGMSDRSSGRLQKIQNTAARILTL